MRALGINPYACRGCADLDFANLLGRGRTSNLGRSTPSAPARTISQNMSVAPPLPQLFSDAAHTTCSHDHLPILLHTTRKNSQTDPSLCLLYSHQTGPPFLFRLFYLRKFFQDNNFSTPDRFNPFSLNFLARLFFFPANQTDYYFAFPINFFILFSPFFPAPDGSTMTSESSH